MKEGWTYKKLGEVCEKITDGSHNPPKGVVKSENIMLSSQNVQNDYLDMSNARYISDEDFRKEDQRTSASKGDVLLTIVGTIGRTCVLKGTEGNITFQRSVAVLKPSNNILSRFLMFFLLSQNSVLNTTAQGAAQKGIYLKQLGNLGLFYPPLSEQQTIVDYLDSAFAKIDAMKANAEKALNEAKALFQASLKKMLEPKEGWEQRQLQEVAYDFSRGKSKHRPRNDKKLFGGKYPFIQTGEIRNSNVYVTSHSSTYNEFGLSQSKLWPEDTVCITIAANIAEVAILKYPSCFPDSVIGFVADNNKVDKMFVFFSLLNYQQELKKQGKGSAQDNINLGTFEKNKFPFPSLQEQLIIVENLDSLKTKVDRLQENFDKITKECDALKQAILKHVFNEE